MPGIAQRLKQEASIGSKASEPDIETLLDQMVSRLWMTYCALGRPHLH